MNDERTTSAILSGIALILLAVVAINFLSADLGAVRWIPAGGGPLVRFDVNGDAEITLRDLILSFED